MPSINVPGYMNMTISLALIYTQRNAIFFAKLKVVVCPCEWQDCYWGCDAAGSRSFHPAMQLF